MTPSNQTAEERIERAEQLCTFLRLRMTMPSDAEAIVSALAADAKRAREERDEAVKRAEKIEFTHKRRVIEAELRMKEERDQALERAAKAEERALRLKQLVDDFKSASMLDVGGDPDGVTPDLLEAHVTALHDERDRYATLIASMQQTWEALEKAVESKDPDAIAKATIDWSAARSAVLTAKVGQ